jgi:1,2-phenylacetyl-CoA epoxidase catalytic subunit
MHAIDELRHGVLFRRRAAEMMGRGLTSSASPEAIAGAGHGLDDLNVEEETDDTMLAFLHLSEKAAASRFTIYRDVMHHDPATRAVFEEILHDEMFHMNYTLAQLVRVSPERHRRHLWRARLSRLWKAYLRLATALAGVMGGLLLTIQYFVVLPLFALFAKRGERREPRGWKEISPERNGRLDRQY